MSPGRPASVPLRHTIASSALATQHSLKWLDGVSDALAYGLRQLRDLRPLRPFGNTPAPTPPGDYRPSLSLSMAGSGIGRPWRARPGTRWTADGSSGRVRVLRATFSSQRHPEGRGKPFRVANGWARERVVHSVTTLLFAGLRGRVVASGVRKALGGRQQDRAGGMPL